MPTPQPTLEPTPTPTPTPVPAYVQLPGDAQFTQITAGKWHACGLQNDGTALCWGSNVSGSLEIPDGYRTLSQIDAGLNFTCGLREDGAIACWGQNNMGQSSPPDGRFDEIAVGSAHACALDEGALVCWGRGFPNGAETIQDIPPLSAIQAGGRFTCGLTSDADMACLSTVDSELAITPGPFIDIGTGLHHVCAIRNDGSVFCDKEDQSHYSQRSQPPSTKFVQISGGWYYTCGVTEFSDIECWGGGVPGAPGERLGAPEGRFTAVSLGWRATYALRSNGYATFWQQPDVQPLHRPEADKLDSSDQLSSTIQLSEAFGGIEFEQPVDLFPLPDGRLAVVDLRGTITAYSDAPNAAPPKTMLDLTGEAMCCLQDSDSGMFSAALDPQFEKFPFLYVYYRVVSQHAYGENMSEIVGRLARFRVVGGKAVRDSELTILEVPLTKSWHFGGAVRFGSDGMLYLGIGHNSSPHKAQPLDTLLGKIIRIDVRGGIPEQPYLAPPDNPFVNNPDALPAIWAYGVRSPWRMSFAPDGRLFVGDVGQATREEVSIATAGANLGWPMCEGNVCAEAPPDAAGRTAPIYTYGHSDGCAVIGGVTAPWLNNGFIFGDYCSKRVFLLEQDRREGWRTRLLAQMEGFILSFGIDTDGTVYVLTRRNPIMRLQPVVAE